MGDQHGILGLDDDQVLDANGGHQTVVRLHQAIVGVDRQHIAFKAVVIGIVRAHVPDRRPAAQVVPAGIQRYDQTGFGVLHDCIVHRLIGAQRELLGRDMREIAVNLRMRQRHAAGTENIRAMTLKLGQKHRGAEHEHAAVPQVRTA